MNRLTAFLLVVVVVLSAVLLIVVVTARQDPAEGRREPVPNTDANVGKCIQGHRVLWHESRAQAAEACLASLGEVGEQSFSQTWHNFETDLHQW